MTSSRTATGGTGSQTLSRGLRALEILADAERPVSISELADSLGAHRSSAYRVLRTLEEHRFVLRDDAGLIRLGPRLAAIARSAISSLNGAALPVLTELANSLEMTCFIAVLDATEIITVTTVEPSHSHTTVAQKPGARHPISQGAPGHAIESLLSEDEHRALLGAQQLSEGAQCARDEGFVLSHDEVIRGLTSVAIPLDLPGHPPAALAVVHIGTPENLTSVVAQLHRAALRIIRAIA